MNHWQQKLPLSLHKTGIVEGSEKLVCSKLHKIAVIQVHSIHLQTPRIAGQIWGDAKVLGAPVAKVFEDGDQCPAGGAERVGDLRRRGAHCPSVDDAIPFQFTELRGENFFADASQKIAEFGEAQRAKRKSPD